VPWFESWTSVYLQPMIVATLQGIEEMSLLEKAMVKRYECIIMNKKDF